MIYYLFVCFLYDLYVILFVCVSLPHTVSELIVSLFLVLLYIYVVQYCLYVKFVNVVMDSAASQLENLV